MNRIYVIGIVVVFILSIGFYTEAAKCRKGDKEDCDNEVEDTTPDPMMDEDKDKDGDFKILDDYTDFGRKRVRLMRMLEESGVYYIKELVADVKVKLDTHDAYKYGNNSKLVSTNSVENRVYAVAKEKGVETIEQFALDVCENILEAFDGAKKCKCFVEEIPWRRMDNQYTEHNHAFVNYEECTRFTEIQHAKDEEAKIYSGIKDLRILKTAMSGFTDFIMDDYNTFSGTPDRVLSTNAYVRWAYAEPAEDYDEVWWSVKNITMKVFSGPPETGEFSNSVQDTAYKIATKILKDHEELKHIFLELPRVNYNLVELAAGLENDNEVYYVYEDPHDFISIGLERNKMEE